MSKAKKFLTTFLLSFLLILTHAVSLGENARTDVTWPSIVLTGIEAQIEVHVDHNKALECRLDDKEMDLTRNEGEIIIPFEIHESGTFKIYLDGALLAEKKIVPIPLWFSILPPLFAILLALIFREVVVSLLLGIFLGCIIPALYSQGISGIIPAFLSIVDHYVIDALNDADHLAVIVFSMLIGAAVSLISKNGGMAGVVNRLSRYAKSRRSGQLVTWFLGIVIFFDDYANTLIVGNTMRPVTDKLKISREKLAYIVDSTAAPIAAIAFVTTWIGAELGYIQDGIRAISGMDANVYQVFLNSLQYSFYPIFTLIFIAMLIWMKKDYGPMIVAERKMVDRNTKEAHLINVSEDELKDFEAAEGCPERPINAILPVTTIIVVTLIGLFVTGYDRTIWSDQSVGIFRKLSAIVGGANAYMALLWSSLSGLMVASLLTLGQRILSLRDTVGSIINGFKAMLTAMIILILAWSLSAVTEDLHTADFLTQSMSGALSPYAIPVATFILSALVSFATGSSWGTMAILYPMMLPLSWTICQISGFGPEESMSIFYNVVSSVLAGSVLGDHCSPISDTTILSSLASSCNHIEHVRTQLPYALTVGGVSIFLGTLPASFGLPFYLSLILGIAVMYSIIRKFGKEI